MVEYPVMRKSLLRDVRLLANPEKTRSEWAGENHCFMDILKFFDDLALENKEFAIGYTLKNEAEWEMIQELMSKTQEVYDAVGPFAPDDEYLSHGKWNEIVIASRNVLAVWVDDE